MIPNNFEVRVYMEDVDAMGCVYHPNYLKFCERARTELFRNHGFCHATLIKEKQNFFVMRYVKMDYVLPSFLKDVLTVRTSVIKIGGASMLMQQDIYREQTLMAKLEACLVYVDNTFKALKIPQDLRDLFQNFLIQPKTDNGAHDV